MIGFLMRGFALEWESLFVGACIGVAAGSLGVGSEALTYGWLQQMRERTATLVRVVMFTLAGSLGYIIGMHAGVWILSGTFAGGSGARAFFIAVAAAGLVGLLIGMPMFIYNQLRERLAASIERVKETEFAQRELEIAREMQRRLLPESEMQGDGWKVVARNEAAHYVAGDFYDVFPMQDGSMGLVVADVAGKGVGASLIMATAKALIPVLAASNTPAGTLQALDARLRPDLSRREFVAIAICTYHPATGRLAMANAGLPDAMIRRNDGSVETVVTTGPRLPVGAGPRVRYEETTLDLAIGDRLLLFSDGLPEAGDGEGEQLGYEALESMVSHAGAAELSSWISEILARTVGNDEDRRLADDVTVLALERTA